MYKQILVPHAGTEGGNQALDHAIHIARSSKAKIILLHVVEEAQYPPTFALSESERKELIKSVREVNEKLRETMDEQIKTLAKKCQEKNVKAEVETVIGSAAEEILKIANKNIDLIVMAKRRKLKGVKRLLSLGSVSRKVIENVSCPVLLINAEQK